MANNSGEVTRSRPNLWDKERMFEVTKKMYDIPGEYDGLRRGGSQGDIAVRAYLEQEFKNMGLTEVLQMDVPFCKEEYTNWQLTVEGESVPCYFLRGAKFTDSKGINAELIYVGNSVNGHNVKDKIVVLEMAPAYMDLEMVCCKGSYFYLDNHDSFKGANVRSQIMTKNWPTEYYEAFNAGAAGILVVLPFETGTSRFYPDVSFRVYRKLPGLYLGLYDGKALIEKIQSSTKPITANLIVEGFVDEHAKSANVIGFLKGVTDDAIIVNSHIDTSFRGAVQDASGVAVVLALAAYYANVPDYYRQKDMYFVLNANHYEWNYPQGSWDFLEKFPHVKEKACLAMTVEHIGVKAEAVNGRYEPTNEKELGIFLAPQNKNCIAIASAAMKKHNLDRTFIPTELFQGYPSEARATYLSNIPTFSYATAPDYLLLEDDRPELVDKELLEVVRNVFLDIIDWAMYRASSVLKKIDTF